MYKNLVQWVAFLAGMDALYFDAPLSIQGRSDVTLWAVIVDNAGIVYAMDQCHKWYEVRENNEDDAQVLDALHNRVREMHQAATAKKEVSA